jgi:hypothetical protein
MSKEQVKSLIQLLPGSGEGYYYIEPCGYVFNHSRKAKRTLTNKIIDSAILEVYKYLPAADKPGSKSIQQYVSSAFNMAIDALITYMTPAKFTLRKRAPTSAGPLKECPDNIAQIIIKYLRDKTDLQEEKKKLEKDISLEDEVEEKQKKPEKRVKQPIIYGNVSSTLTNILDKEFDGSQLLTPTEARHALSTDRIHRIALLLRTQLSV